MAFEDSFLIRCRIWFFVYSLELHRCWIFLLTNVNVSQKESDAVIPVFEKKHKIFCVTKWEYLITYCRKCSGRYPIKLDWCRPIFTCCHKHFSRKLLPFAHKINLGNQLLFSYNEFIKKCLFLFSKKNMPYLLGVFVHRKSRRKELMY